MFEEMDTKQKVVIIGGGALVGLFLLRSVFSKGSSSAAPSSVALPDSTNAQLGDQISKAISSAQDSTNKQIETIATNNSTMFEKLGGLMGGYQDATTKLIAATTDTFGHSIDTLGKNFTDALNTQSVNTQKAIDAQGAQITAQGNNFTNAITAQQTAITSQLTKLFDKMATPVIQTPAPAPYTPPFIQPQPIYYPGNVGSGGNSSGGWNNGTGYVPPAPIVTQPSQPSQPSRPTVSDVAQQIKDNGNRWNNATSDYEKQLLHDENVKLGSSIGATYDSGKGEWVKDGKVIN